MSKIRNFFEQHFGNLLLISVPALGYLIAFYYGKGVADYFNIPIDYISINLTLLIIAIKGTAIIIVIFAAYFLFFYKIINDAFKFKTILQIIIYIILSILIVGSVFWFFTKELILSLKFCSLMAALALIAYFINSFFKNNPKKKQGIKIFIIFLSLIFVVIFICSTANSIGESSSKKQTQFLVEKDNRDIVLLTKYGSTYILANVNRDTNTVLSITFSDDSGMLGKEFKLENVGTLKVVQPESQLIIYIKTCLHQLLEQLGMPFTGNTPN